MIHFDWKFGSQFTKCSVTAQAVTFSEAMKLPEPPKEGRNRVLVITGGMPVFLATSITDEWKKFYTALCIYVPASDVYVCFASTDKMQKGRVFTSDEVEKDYKAMMASFLDQDVAADLSNVAKNMPRRLERV